MDRHLNQHFLIHVIIYVHKLQTALHCVFSLWVLRIFLFPQLLCLFGGFIWWFVCLVLSFSLTTINIFLPTKDTFMTNLESPWAERFSYCKQQFPKVSQNVRANERPILPQAVCPPLSCHGVGQNASGEGRAGWFWATLTTPAPLLCQARAYVTSFWRGSGIYQRNDFISYSPWSSV